MWALVARRVVVEGTRRKGGTQGWTKEWTQGQVGGGGDKEEEGDTGMDKGMDIDGHRWTGLDTDGHRDGHRWTQGRGLSLTALPVGVAEFDVSAGPGRVLAGALGAADALDLVVEGLEGGVHLGVVRPQPRRRLVRPHVAPGVGALLGLPQPRERRHVDTGAGGPGGAGRARVPGGTLREGGAVRG